MGEDWADWHQATFTPLPDAELAERLLARLVDRFLIVAGLSTTRREEALRQVSIEEGRTPKGMRVLRVTLPLGEGHPASEWDGSSAGAAEIVDSMADVAGENVVGDREMGGPTGWEPELDAD